LLLFARFCGSSGSIRHGRTKQTGRKLARHLRKTENEVALLVEVGHCIGDTLREVIALSKIYQAATTSARVSLHHVTINPGADLIADIRGFWLAMVCPLMTHKRHWLCTAAIVLMPVSAPIKVLV